MASVACELLRRFAPERPVRLLGVRVAGLARGGGAEGKGSALADAKQLELRL